MLKIRKEQYEQLGNIALKRFEDTMVEHIREFSPEHYEWLGEPIVRNVIEYGVERAEANGFETEPAVIMYIDLMLLLGSHFDTDPQLPWVAKILADESIADPAARAEDLYDYTIEYLNRIEGPEDEYLGKALDEVGDISFEGLPLAHSDNIKNTTVSFLQRIWPEKCRAIGADVLNQLVIYGTESAQSYDIIGQRGVVLYTVLMFMLGSGFDSDPQFPWAVEALKDESAMNEAVKIDRLYKKAIACLDKWLVES
jgi:hypothetical protein